MSRRGPSALNLPREPYPGLRPFLDFEAPLMFGRERQVREVVERLARTHFVAVLGGSGSGKSSLIQAGVVPELRSYGIPGAGDLWLTMVCTPGTGVGAGDAARRETPLTRLARRFSTLLKSRGSQEADAVRLAELAEVLRQEAGLARLLDSYGQDLDVPPGPDPLDGRILFVVDQFEELFHPSNAGVPDTQLLVERLLDHFFNPHPRCYVVLTMRSEFLNDCAAYLELPDAINASSYLVRRLDGSELRAVIEAPAQRYLRLIARGHADPRLPDTVQFEPAVIERVIRDTTAISHDPDHLPLLQHLLARLWQAALEREEEIDVLVPGRIGEADLVRAVNPTGWGRLIGLPVDMNTLRACVENWPEMLYSGRSPAERAGLDAVLRQLAFRDPRTGHYSQQRLDVEQAARELGPGKTAIDLRALLSEGFLGGVDYLFWDDSDPERPTIKVSHESFIRGWSRLRALVDQRSQQFERYVELLRRTAEWQALGRSDGALLDTRSLRLVQEARVEEVVSDPMLQASWPQLLATGHERLSMDQAAGEAAAYLARSTMLQRRRTRTRWFVLTTVPIGIVLGAVVAALAAILIVIPTQQRVDLLFEAGRLAGRPWPTNFDSLEQQAQAVQPLLRAAENVERARSGRGVPLGPLSQRLLEALGDMALVRRQREFLDGVLELSEPQVNRALRGALGAALWPVDPAALSGPPPGRTAAQRLDSPPTLPDVACSEASVGRPVTGRLFVAHDDWPIAPAGWARAVFAPAPAPGERTKDLRAAMWRSADGRCVLGASLLDLNEAQASSVVFDPRLRYLLVAIRPFTTGGGGFLFVYSINWQADGTARPVALEKSAITQLTDLSALERVRSAAGPSDIGPVPAESHEAGWLLDVAGARWLLAHDEGRRVTIDSAALPRPLELASAGSPCRPLFEAEDPTQPGTRGTLLQDERLCIGVRSSPLPVPVGADTPPGGVLVQGVSVYRRPALEPERAAQRAVSVLAGLGRFSLWPAGAPPLAWSMGTGRHAGWLLQVPPGADASTAVLLGAPVETCALWALGTQIAGRGVPAGHCE